MSDHSKQTVLRALDESGVVGIIRTDKSADLLDVAKALVEGGVRFVEVTMTVPDALDVVRQARQGLESEGVFLGVGTVLDATTARLAILAGASYIISPIINQEVIATCLRYDVAVMPGAMTPTEILTAWEWGASVVKVFPAGLGGAQYFKDVMAPLPHIRMMPTGGVNIETVADFINAGACAVGVGSALLSPDLLASKDYATITSRARKFVEIVQQAKQK